MDAGGTVRRSTALAVLLCAAVPAFPLAQTADPVRKAKDTVRQGEMQLDRLREELRNENYDAALRVLREYRDAVVSAQRALKESGRDAEKKPDGFKNLQIHIRRNLPQLQQSILSIPVELREPFEDVRKELDKIDRELIDALFPRQPEKKPGTAKPGRNQ